MATGLAALALYAALAGLLLVGAVPLAAAATALIAVQAARSALNIAIHATNQVYENALYYSDLRSFLDRAAGHRAPAGGVPVSGFEEIRLEGVGLTYPGTVDPGGRRRVHDAAARRGGGPGRRERVRQVEPGQAAGRSLRTDHRDDHLGRCRLPPRSTLQALGGSGRGDQPGVVEVPVHRRAEHRHRSVGPSAEGGPTVEEAAEAAAAHEMIIELPDGYDTLLDRSSEDGQDLSGGQWQRLVSARGFYRDAPLLICDEPSAALDARAEHALFSQLQRRPDRAVVLITHRLANVRHADRIYVLRQGRLVQEGDHATLMAQGGLYRELFDLQASGYLAVEDR